MKIIAVINATKAVGDISLSLSFAFHVNKSVLIATKQINSYTRTFLVSVIEMKKKKFLKLYKGSPAVLWISNRKLSKWTLYRNLSSSRVKDDKPA